jgi:TRAP-type C4-dicarboxylate transport system substrate-binding protein
MFRILMSTLLLSLLSATPAAAQETLEIKLATLAPEGSTWYTALARLSEEWLAISDGTIKLKIYAGGVTGNETVMLRKMRIGQLHAGAVTNLGLMEIDPSSQVLNIPMLIRDYDELDYVMSALRADFEKGISDNGYTVLGWSEAGWAHMFSKNPITDPEDRGDLKVFVWEGDPAAVKMYEAAGLRPVVLAATDVLPSLQSGLIDSFPSTPLGALALQWFGLAPNMLDVPWAPLLGATIIRTEVWEQVPEDLRPKLMEAARRNGADIQATVRSQDKKAVTVMERYGLKVNKVDPATFKAWEAVAKTARAQARGDFVSAELYDKVVALIAEHRAKTP